MSIPISRGGVGAVVLNIGKKVVKGGKNALRENKGGKGDFQ